ncbi:MAG: hypothetical protein ACODAA_06170 [Gemmatimonadota bacterium]
MIRELRRTTLLTVAVVAATAVACTDPFEPILTPIPEPREAELIDFEQGDLVDAAAYDMLTSSAVRTDQTSGWDFLFVVDDEEGPALLPRSGLLDDDSSAGVQLADGPFDTLESAPEDGYSTSDLVPVAPGDVLLLVSRQNPGVSVRCRVYGKLEVESIEGSPAVLALRVVINPNCERRRLIEEEDED